MSKLPLSFACWNYDRIGALVDGSVQPEGIDLNYLNMPVEETFWRMMRHQEFDVAELSLSSYLIGRDRGYPHVTAIPVFMSRSFRHSGIFVNTSAGIEKPEDLRGRRVGVPEYQLTACLWIRGILQDEYGVAPSSIQWFTGGEETPGRLEKVALQLPPEIHIQPIGPTQTLNEMLESGEIDALIAPRAPSSFLQGSPNVARLFPNYEEDEKAYFQKTGIFPIMHVIAIRDDVLEANPWVAMNLYVAFEKAKQVVYDGFNQTAALKVTLPWLTAEIERTKLAMGDDFWPYGIERNQKTLEAAVRYSYEQGLIKTRPRLEDLFVKSTLERFTI
ncbi:ABC transporter substrate-binding protein [Alicyclobacillus fastidiosus]|uniref:ABC transporter substrate-binding protein n=1 Tax=Alicyclobacillus fastidiosus TaxID=392011 RepID=A0ABY6ZHL9_9BACL|nr:PhnD/SsuA/transferrin family substrate-binding protein [Alicyclobacillus fastidiosus]WAH41621.1 ABC transporter substrate-binding protein [Alicyclobacillus fastidiosus]GMA63287.1 4,5-dihydroxyphthalate decarboxylase [Alicyclobacillus fastidiosus]